MKNEKKKKLISLLLRLSAIAAGAILCVPVTRYLNSLIGEGRNDLSTLSASVFCCCLAALIVLAVVSGLRAMTGRSFRLTVFVIGVTAAVCLSAGYISYTSLPEPSDPASVTPRPTVTPPAVLIEETVTASDNPESGTVFYKKYFDNPASLTVDNAGASDVYIKLRESQGKDVLTFYVRAYNVITVPAPVGTYEYVCAFGKDWANEEDYFGENTKFRKSKEVFIFKWGESCDISISRNASELLDVSIREFER